MTRVKLESNFPVEILEPPTHKADILQARLSIFSRERDERRGGDARRPST